jgi:hypothetical protein
LPSSLFWRQSGIQAGNKRSTRTGCCRLIQKCIILWNHFYLSELIFNTDTSERKKEILEILLEGSILTWQHINLLGEYNFQELDNENVPFNFRENNGVGTRDRNVV